MANTMLAERPQDRAVRLTPAVRERLVVQRPFRTPDQCGGAVTMWANLAGLWGIVGLEPPRQAWPFQNGQDVAVWVASDYRTGIEPGFRVLLRGETFTIGEVVCLHEYQPGMWLRVVRGERTEDRTVA